MNTEFLATTVIVLIGLAGTGWAQEAAPAAKPDPAAEAAAQDRVLGSDVDGISADDLIGMSVVDSDGEHVGKVSHLIIGQDDLVHHAIVEVGGFFGFGATTTMIHLEHATVDRSQSEVTLGITRAEIDAMSAYQRGANGSFAG